MDIVVIVSPAKPENLGLSYARSCVRNSLLRGEVPLPVALMFDNILLPENPAEREAGIVAACFAAERADRVAVYIDEGISEEMRRVIARAIECGVPVVYRTRISPAQDMPLIHVAVPRELDGDDRINRPAGFGEAALQLIVGGKTA